MKQNFEELLKSILIAIILLSCTLSVLVVWVAYLLLRHG